MPTRLPFLDVAKVRLRRVVAMEMHDAGNLNKISTPLFLRQDKFFDFCYLWKIPVGP